MGDLAAGSLVVIKGVKKPGCHLKTSEKEVKSMIDTSFTPCSSNSVV